MTSGPVQASRSQPKSAMVTVGSKTRLIRSATVPPVSVKTANWSGSVVSLSNHQPGWRPMSMSVRTDSVGGIVKPLWTSRSRAPATGVSTVRISAPKPAASARSDQVEAGLAVAPQVELEPAVGVGGGRGHGLRRRRPERRQRVRDAEAPGDARDRGLAVLVHQPGEAGRGEDQRHRRRAAEDGRGQVDRRDVAQHARDELDPRVRLARATQARLGLGGPVDVVEDGARDVPTGDRAQVRDRRRRGQPALDRRQVDRTVRRYGRSSDGRGSRRRVIDAHGSPVRPSSTRRLVAAQRRSWRGRAPAAARDRPR